MSGGTKGLLASAVGCEASALISGSSHRRHLHEKQKKLFYQKPFFARFPSNEIVQSGMCRVDPESGWGQSLKSTQSNKELKVYNAKRLCEHFIGISKLFKDFFTILSCRLSYKISFHDYRHIRKP
jgi:hypothetical protein